MSEVDDLDGVAEGDDPGGTRVSAMRLVGLPLELRRKWAGTGGGVLGEPNENEDESGLKRKGRVSRRRSAREGRNRGREVERRSRAYRLKKGAD